MDGLQIRGKDRNKEKKQTINYNNNLQANKELTGITIIVPNKDAHVIIRQ